MIGRTKTKRPVYWSETLIAKTLYYHSRNHTTIVAKCLCYCSIMVKTILGSIVAKNFYPLLLYFSKKEFRPRTDRPRRRSRRKKKTILAKSVSLETTMDYGDLNEDLVGAFTETSKQKRLCYYNKINLVAKTICYCEKTLK
jgi:hypothetical protein